MCYEEAFGTICDSGFGVPEATVVCTALGYSSVGEFWFVNSILQHELKCIGKFAHLNFFLLNIYFLCVYMQVPLL